MKNLKLTFAIIAMMVFSSSFANSPLKPAAVATSSQLQTEINDFFKDELVNFKAEDVKTEVTFTLNKSNEIVVIDVESSDDDVSYFVESVLNDKELKSEEVKRGGIYTLPIRLIVENK